MKNRAFTIAIWTLPAIAVTAVLAWVHWRWRWMDQILGVLGSYASLVGLVVTWYVAVTVRQVKQRYVDRISQMQNFERYKKTVAEFEKATTGVGYQSLAGEICPLVKELGVHFPGDESVQSLVTGLNELMSCPDARNAIAMAKGYRSRLRSFQSQVEIHREKDDWRRDNG